MTELDMFLEEKDEIALNTRINLLHDKTSPETKALTTMVIKSIRETQLPNGSWGNTIYKTIPTLRLLVDAYKHTTALFQKGFNWLLSLKGPSGFHEYSEEGQKVYCRDEYCPYGSELGSPELTGRVLHLCGKIGFTNPAIDEVIESMKQFRREDNGFHGAQFWEQDKKSCIGATLWVTRGLLKLNREPEIVEGAINFIENAEITHNVYQFSTSALALETLYLYNPEKTECVNAHIDYLLSLRNGNTTWNLGSNQQDRKEYRHRLFTVLKAISKFDPDIIPDLQ